MALLDGAVANDPKCSLFVGKRGEMFIELGPDGYGRAEADLKKAIELSEDWAPAWIALADLEARRGQPDRAGKYLKGAEQSLEVLAEKEKKNPTPPFKIMGLTIAPDAPPEKGPRDPSLDKAERRQLILAWLQENEQWTIESPSLLIPVSGGGAKLNANNLNRRLRARVEFEWIVLRLFRGETAQEVLPKFDHIFEWDPDLFPARIEKAVQLRRAGKYREAERLLRPYVDTNDPKLANNARLIHEMAGIYTDWYVSEPDPKLNAELSKEAEQMFVRLHKVNPQHAAGWISRAHLYAVAGLRGKKLATLKDARQWLDNARELLGTETADIKRVQQEVDQAEKSLKAPAAAAPTGAKP